MYGMPLKRFDPDIYKDRRGLKNLDLAIGFLAAAGVWFILFRPVWYAGPVVVGLVGLTGLLTKFERRYIIYGALSVIFAPLLLWASATILKYGTKE